MFAWVNGEEKGLLGSEFYVSDPVVPLEKTLININLDMVGRSKMPSDTGNLWDSMSMYLSREKFFFTPIRRVMIYWILSIPNLNRPG